MIVMNMTFIKYKEKYILLFLDFAAFNAAYYVTYILRFSTGWFENNGSATIFIPGLYTSLYWMTISAMRGQYRPLYGLSRLDSLWNTFKTTGIGILLIYIAITLSDEPPLSQGKLALLFYWIILVFFTGGARVFLRTLQHKLILQGIALSPTLIIGFNERGKNLLDEMDKHPTMGFKAVGFVDDENIEGEYKNVKILGNIDELDKLISEYGILEVIITLKKSQEELTEKVIDICGQQKVNMKIMPEIKQMIYGQVKMQSVYGMPLIELFPQLVKPGELILKRTMDIVLAALVLILSLPIIIVTAIVIKIDSKGPIFYSQKRVGKDGNEFNIYKFRSMVVDAEKFTGAKWAEKNDPRVTKVGKFLRISRIDEIPQFFNVLIGNMSLVGPRPERKFFVDQFVKQIPLYNRRHNVKPGITGYGQLRGVYDASIEDVKTRLSLDMQYINNMSVALDIKILWQTVFLVLRGTGQ